ncbi:MAG: Fe(3+) ABC transporter substrate-binding protein [Rhodospirillales bacterium]|nr:Fe(3+) ABC transporter substrate-binding protein [Rhodospirillales bacterium]
MRTKLIRFIAFTATLALLSSVLVAPSVLSAEDGETVNIYSARKEALILPILERFQEETGIEFHLVTGKADALLKRLQLEGEATPADVFITVDAGRLHRAKEAGVLQTIGSETIDAAVPAHLRDADGYWVALSKRARTIMYANGRVDPAALSTYEGLTDPMWEGRICIRSSGNIYNQSLVASMIEANGAEQAEAWAKGMVANFARPPAGGDTDQLRAAAAGECDIAVANTYYFGRLAASAKEEDQAVAAVLTAFWPNQSEGERGVHVNVSGVGITAHAQNRDTAIRLIEFLVSPEAQAWYAEVNHEYPVVPGVPASETLESFGAFAEDTLNLTALGANNRQAVELMDRAGWR